MTMDNINTFSDEITLKNEVNEEVETVFDIFGKSVAMQLKALSQENALLAQSRIQSVLTEFGITDYRQRSACKDFISNYRNQISEYVEETNVNYDNDVTSTDPNHISPLETIQQSDEYSQLPSEIVYVSLDEDTSHLKEVIYENSDVPIKLDTELESSDDATTAAMSAAYAAVQNVNKF